MYENNGRRGFRVDVDDNDHVDEHEFDDNHEHQFDNDLDNHDGACSDGACHSPTASHSC